MAETKRVKKKTTPAKAKSTAKSKLVIVESPAKARTISKFLGSGYKVYASNGHIRDLPKSQLGVDVDNHFEPKYITIRGRGNVLDKLKKEAKSSSRVFLATDPDREGEAISWHISKALELPENEPNRIVFNEITKNAIQNAIKNPRALDQDLINAQQARRVLDRLVGYKISPILWKKVRKGLSAGREQPVATRLIVDREAEIEAFIPEEYWVITARLHAKGERKAFEAKFHGDKSGKLELKCKDDAMGIVDRLTDAEYTVASVKKAIKSKHAPAPFTTSNMQQEASRKLNFTTKRTMMVAQQLYEGIDVGGKGAIGLITYIRTDSVRVASEAQNAVRGLIAKRYGAEYVPEKPNFYKGRKGAQDAHEAIRPTHPEITPESLKDSVTPDQYKLYKLVYERFLASQMSEYRYESISVSIEANGLIFRAQGTRPIFAGFTAVYIEGRDDARDEKDIALPELNEGDILRCGGIKPDQHFTQPPPRYTEASLVKALEEKDIGRPSTYSPTISTILDRGYVVKQSKLIVPTELGKIVTQLMKENFVDIVNVEFTAGMEKELDEIEEGVKPWEGVISEFYSGFLPHLEKAEKEIEKIELVDEVSDVPCDKCGAMMVFKHGRFGKFLACPRFPECRNAKPIVEPITVPCPKCGGRILKKKSKKGRMFFGCEKYPECDFVSWDMPSAEKCPECGGVMVVKKDKAGNNKEVCVNKECKFSRPMVKTKKTAAP